MKNKIQNNKKTNLSAVITVESSIIFPIVFFITALLIMLCFYLHDKIVSNSLSYRDCIYLANNNSSNSSDYADENYLVTTINTFLLSHKVGKPTLEINEESIKITNNYDGHKTIHTYTSLSNCNNLRKYSIILKLIKEH